MKTILPKDLNPVALQTILQTAIAPRPIALASTVDKNGNENLSPFSFFNMFSTKPPILVFSPSRRVRDNTTKHTLENILEVPEVVIGIVNFKIVQQISLASTEYEKGVNEFDKSGLTMVNADLVKPKVIKECPVNFECRVNEVKALGNEGGILPVFKGMIQNNPNIVTHSQTDVFLWNHVEDMAGIFAFALENNLDGVFNSVAPEPASTQDVFKAISNKMNGTNYEIKPFQGQHLVSNKIINAGYQFKFPNIEGAIKNLIN